MNEELKPRRGLGRGLSALLGDHDAGEDTAAVAVEEGAAGDGRGGVRMLPVERLRPGKFQPRRMFDDAAIHDLVESVREKGVLQPILVRPDPGNPSGFEIIAGERRWRAAQLAQQHEVPVLVKDFDDREAAEVALVENLQRQDLSPLEEAEGYRRLMDEFARTQEDLAKAVGKSRSHVANTMRLLGLPDGVKTMLDGGQITAGHARALLSAADPVKLAQQVVARGLNVRQTEKLVQSPAKARKDRPAAHKDADTAALERDLAAVLGLKVSIKFSGQGGELVIHYGSLEQLDDILHRLSHGSRAQPGEPVPLDDGEVALEPGDDWDAMIADAPEDDEAGREAERPAE